MKTTTAVASICLALVPLHTVGSPVESEGVTATQAGLSTWDFPPWISLFAPLDSLWDSLWEWTGTSTKPRDMVPGNSIIWHCKKTGPNDTLAMNLIDTYPEVLQRNKPASFNVKAQLKEDLQEGSKVELRVKYHGIRVYKHKFDICDELKKINIQCPVKAGSFAFNKTITVPDRSIPKGKYQVRAKANTKDGKTITCLTMEKKYKG